MEDFRVAWLVDHEDLTGTPAAHKAYKEWKNQQEEREDNADSDDR